MDADLMFKVHHNHCMKMATAAKGRLRVMTRLYGIVPEQGSGVNIACHRAVALCGS
jgi:hypothetical protein